MSVNSGKMALLKPPVVVRTSSLPTSLLAHQEDVKHPNSDKNNERDKPTPPHSEAFEIL